MAFTEEELTQAIEKVVQTSIRVQYGSLGNRRIDLVFDDLRNAASGVFLSEANAVFYVVALAIAKVQKLLESERVDIGNLLEAITGVGRSISPVSNLSPLANARAALEALESASGSRTSSFGSIVDITAFQRFDDNTQRFLDESGKNIREAGDTARTPNESRLLLSSIQRELKDAHTEVLRRIALIAGAVSDYSAMNLPGLLSASVISKSRQVLDAHYDELAALPENDRLEKIREVTLDILAARAVVKGFGSLSSPTTFLVFDSGSAQAFADSSHPATPASILSNLYGPYPIVPGKNNLHVTLDGGSPLTIPIQSGFVAALEGTIGEPFDITSGAGNNILRITLVNYPAGSSTSVDTTFTNDTAKPITEVVTELNTAIPAGVPLVAETFVNSLKLQDLVNITNPGTGADVDISPVNPSTNFLTLGIEAGDSIIVRDDTSAHNEFIYDVVTATATVLSCNVRPPSVAAASETGKTVIVGTNVFLRVRISDDTDGVATWVQPNTKTDYRSQALIDRVHIFIPETGPSTKAVQKNTAYNFGYVPLMDSVSRPVTAQDVVTTLNSSSFNQVAGKQRVLASAEFTATLFTGTAKSSPADASDLEVSTFTGVTDIPSGTSVVLTTPDLVAGQVLTGYRVVILASAVPADVGKEGTVTSVSGIYVSVTMDSAVSASSQAFSVVSFGPDLRTGYVDCSVVLADGGPNDGVYVASKGSGTFSLTLDRPLPYFAAPGGQPVAVSAEVGRYRVRFASTTQSLATFVTLTSSVDGPEALFFTSLPAGSPGTTKYVKLPAMPVGLEEGDTLEIHLTTAVVTSQTCTVLATDTTNKLIEVSPEVTTSLASLAMPAGSSPPFARIRKAIFDGFNSLEASLTTWLTGSANQPGYFQELTRLVNPLIANLNPTPSQLNDARVQVALLTSALDSLDTLLASYQAPVVHEVDTLLASFIEKGADKAVDTLLECSFSSFFGLDQQEVSYSGSVQKSIQAISREDLPVRRNNRTGQSNELIAAYDDVDFNFDHSDVDDVGEPDIPDA